MHKPRAIPIKVLPVAHKPTTIPSKVCCPRPDINQQQYPVKCLTRGPTSRTTKIHNTNTQYVTRGPTSDRAAPPCGLPALLPGYLSVGLSMYTGYNCTANPICNRPQSQHSEIDNDVHSHCVLAAGVSDYYINKRWRACTISLAARFCLQSVI
jgi:hypothetical protein